MFFSSGDRVLLNPNVYHSGLMPFAGASLGYVSFTHEPTLRDQQMLAVTLDQPYQGAGLYSGQTVIPSWNSCLLKVETT